MLFRPGSFLFSSAFAFGHPMPADGAWEGRWLVRQGSAARVRIYPGKFRGTEEPTVFQDLTVFNGATLADGVFVG